MEVAVSFFFFFFFFISIREQSGQRLFFFSSVFWMQQSITSTYFLKLLRICTGERSHFFSLNLRASLVLHIIGTSSAFVKKKRIGLCFTDGNMWPSKTSIAPPKNWKGAKHGPQNYWPGDNTVTLSLHGRMYYLPKFEAYIKRWDPQFQWWDPHHIQSWVPRTPKHSTWCKTLLEIEIEISLNTISFCLLYFFTSQSALIQSCRDRSSCVEPIG